jgi:hypothetical protein
MARSITKVNDSESILETTKAPEDAAKATYNMTLNNVPVMLRDKFKRLKNEGKITGSFNAYIRQAIIDRLKADDI